MASSIMLDIETLSTRPNATIVSIGAVKFDFDWGITERFYINVDPSDGKRLGCHIEEATCTWWSKQPVEASSAWRIDPKPVQHAIKEFSDWIGPDGHMVWANGAAFDIPILENSFRLTEQNIPWKYWHINDYRTVLNILGYNNKKLRSADKNTVYHNALDDAVFQAETLIKLLGPLQEP